MAYENQIAYMPETRTKEQLLALRFNSTSPYGIVDDDGNQLKSVIIQLDEPSARKVLEYLKSKLDV